MGLNLSNEWMKYLSIYRGLFCFWMGVGDEMRRLNEKLE